MGGSFGIWRRGWRCGRRGMGRWLGGGRGGALGSGGPGGRGGIGERTGEGFGVWRSRGAERVFKEARADVVLMPQQTVFPRGVGVPYVLVVHDLQHVERLASLPWFDRHFRPRAFGVALEGA